ncbi:MAG: amidohydrolase family protein [Myxococcaceae bacterium]
MTPFDLVIENGLVFDGTGAPPQRVNVGVRDGRIAALTADPLPAKKKVDAAGKWVTPGFIDLHTHYDAEVELSPGLTESLKHGVTTVTVGSCSLSLALGTPEDLADQFCRVEAVPYDVVRSLLEERKRWNSHAEYFAHLDSLPLGPNVSSFVGHSAVRANVMGLERSLSRNAPTAAELQQMEAHVQEGLDAGALGLSIQTLPWDKVGGTRDVRSRPLPSTWASWSEYRRLIRHLRARGRVLQGVPNITTKVNIVLFLLESIGLWRPKLKTTVISMMDTRANRGLHRLTGFLSRLVNKVLGADFRWQALPDVFELWSDGIDLVVFEEFGAGAAALHLDDDAERARLLDDPAYRARFKQQWKSAFLPRVFHRDFNHSKVLDAPDASLIGKSFAQLAAERGEDVCDTFLGLVARYGKKLRWNTVMANDRPDILADIVSHPDVLIGFSDAGAHLRNMAHYNFPLRLLRLAQDTGCLTPEAAVHRLTGEIADWLGLDAGSLKVGARADVVVLDPARLDARLDQTLEATMPFFDASFRRLVNQDGGAIDTVLVNGHEVVREGQLSPSVGQQRSGRMLRAGQPLVDAAPVARAA